MNLIYANAIIIIILIIFWTEDVASQRTSLDEKLGQYYRSFRLIGASIAGPSRQNKNNINDIERVGKTHTISKREFVCNSNTGPPKRSDKPPKSVHRLRPGDIDIIGAMGDSLTAGNGILASNIFHIGVENRGVSWSIGGQGNWQEYLTLPNILKEFNPNLYGYSLSDGLTTDRSSKFNVAELGAMSRDLPFEAKVLVKRLTADKKVNFNDHWKLITILIGNNDFCSDMCYYPNPKLVLKWHEQNMLKTLRFLRDNVPRLMVNIVPAPNLRLLTKLVNMPNECQATLRFECPCLIGKDNDTLNYLESIMLEWIELDEIIANRDEFNTETFTVNIQPFTKFGELPKKSNGGTDFRNLSVDCFHLSQRGQASCANALWNNMLEINGNKTSKWREAFEKVLCPTFERPYLATRSNSRSGS
ncbi:phospholipase B1, membrane-associated [Episyrphus balteatus]|uniref:phospholipase B1, membrane-associated n=1 Tax=Episyrphus balteatus TaxID=286459 RepID=UPI0024854D5F|nr:phospholipase B1, membrane-associated [Episyrphus balteatus]